jgi:FMN reductase
MAENTRVNGSDRPLAVGIGGTLGGVSTTERALSACLDALAEQGFETQLFGGEALGRLPLYAPGDTARTAEEQAFVAAVRQASAVVIASPGYHGGVSGVVKNALDLLEETSRDARPYLTDLPVGLIATAAGWQATGTTLSALRDIAHALRGWPTPFGAALNTGESRLLDPGAAGDQAARRQLQLVAAQVARFASAERTEEQA